MAFGPRLEKLLKKLYTPSSTINMALRGNDMTIVTNNNGEAIQLFIGKRKQDGNIRGDRYARVLKRDEQGNTIKDHWERKGPAS